jgi:hypothetical protein
MERNRNGIANTFMAGTKVPIKATLVRLRSMAPARVCSMVSFSFAELARMKYANLQPACRLLLDQPAHEAERLDRRIILALGVGGAKFACRRARRDGRQKQRSDDDGGPRKAGAGIHGQLIPL